MVKFSIKVMSLPKYPHLRDGVDVYIDDQELLITFVFLSTRQRLQVKAEKELIQILPLLDGETSIETLRKIVHIKDWQKVFCFLQYLSSKGLLISPDWIDDLSFKSIYSAKLKRQFNFMLDILGSPEKVELVQNKIKDTTIAVVGLGGVGSWLLIELAQLGFEKFILVDYKNLEPHSIDRHALLKEVDFSSDKIRKVDYFEGLLKLLSSEVLVTKFNKKITTETNLDFLFDKANFIVNCADEPYIGYTSIRLSRYCVERNIPLLVGGGFDAHLASMSELIIPRKTPCSDCYNQYFQESLKDWKPVKHVIKDRTRGIGGVKALSQFSASSAALKIFQYFMEIDNLDSTSGGRGEFMFVDYSVNFFSVERDENCVVCGDKH